jgi:hypothetical protein
MGYGGYILRGIWREAYIKRDVERGIYQTWLNFKYRNIYACIQNNNSYMSYNYILRGRDMDFSIYLLR